MNSSIFQGSRIRLCAIEASDWEIFYAWDFDTEIGRLTDEIWFPSSREGARAWAEAESRRKDGDDNFRFKIERLDGEMVGTINTHHCNLRCGTFMYGIAILPQHQRQGFAAEAVRLMLRYYFHERRYQKVNAEVYGFNLPSISFHERLGFMLEGRLRRMIYAGGQYHDALIYGLTREEFEASYLEKIEPLPR